MSLYRIDDRPLSSFLKRIFGFVVKSKLDMSTSRKLIGAVLFFTQILKKRGFLYFKCTQSLSLLSFKRKGKCSCQWYEFFILFFFFWRWGECMYDFFVNLKGKIVLKGGRDIFVSYTLCMFFLTPIISF